MPSLILPTPTDEEARRLKLSLADFFRAAWSVVEGSRDLKWNWHLQCLADHLQALEENRLGTNKVIFNFPPRTTKSTAVSVMFPCWLWARKSWLQFIFASHKLDLARDHAYKRRAILESAWYRELFGESVVLKQDRNSIVEIGTEEQGVMFTASAGASVTGRGADYLIQDDPNNAEQMESEIERASILRWEDVTWSTRANDPAKAKHICMQQRTHVDDVTGHLLKQGGWLHLRIPMEFNPAKKCVTPIWADPRTEHGQLIDPERFPPDYIAERKRALGPYFYAGQYDQEPVPLGGGVLKTSWLGRWHPSPIQPNHIEFRNGVYHIDPTRSIRFATVDLAMTEKEIGAKKLHDPDWTTMGAWVAHVSPNGAELLLMDVIRERQEGPETLEKLKAFHTHWKFSLIAIENIAEKMWYQQARKLGLPVREVSTSKADDVIYTIDRDKISRALAVTPILSQGRVHVPEYAPWLGEFFSEVNSFPNGSHDDQVDMLVMACAITEKLSPRWLSQASSATKQEKSCIDDAGRRRGDQDAPADAMGGYYGNGIPHER